MSSLERALNRFLRTSSNEFFRFNDLKPGTSPRSWWYSVIWLVFILLLVAVIERVPGMLSGQLSLASEVIANSVILFLVIPVSSLYLRRLSDSTLLKPVFNVWFSMRASSTGGAVAFWLLGLAIAAIVIFIWNFLPFWVSLFLLGLTLFPGQGIAKQPASALRVSSVLPAPPSLSSTTIPSPPLPPSLNKQQQFAPRELVEPSKRLFQRGGFWLSVLLALTAFLLPFQDEIEKILDQPQVVDVEETPTPTPTVTVTETQTPTPSAQPSESPSAVVDQPGIQGDLSGGSSTQDDGVVVIVPGSDEEVERDLDPRFKYCTHAIASGYGPYYYGIDPEYSWYNDRDRDGIVCER